MHAQGLEHAHPGRLLGRHEARTGTRVEHVRVGVELRATARRPRVHGPEAGVAERTVFALPRPTALSPGEPARTYGVRGHGPAGSRGLYLDRRPVDLLPACREREHGRCYRLGHARLRDGLRVAGPRSRRPRCDPRVADEDPSEGVGSVCGSHVLAPPLAGAATRT